MLISLIVRQNVIPTLIHPLVLHLFSSRLNKIKFLLIFYELSNALNTIKISVLAKLFQLLSFSVRILIAAFHEIRSTCAVPRRMIAHISITLVLFLHSSKVLSFLICLFVLKWTIQLLKINKQLNFLYYFANIFLKLWYDYLSTNTRSEIKNKVITVLYWCKCEDRQLIYHVEKIESEGQIIKQTHKKSIYCVKPKHPDYAIDVHAKVEQNSGILKYFKGTTITEIILNDNKSCSFLMNLKLTLLKKFNHKLKDFSLTISF